MAKRGWSWDANAGLRADKAAVFSPPLPPTSPPSHTCSSQQWLQTPGSLDPPRRLSAGTARPLGVDPTRWERLGEARGCTAPPSVSREVEDRGDGTAQMALRTLLMLNWPSKRQPAPLFSGIFMELSMCPTSCLPISSWMSSPTTARPRRGESQTAGEAG